MGFYFRKSVKFGPVRFNFSKSGIGVSAGVKGARISTGPRGTYVHAGRNGFYYRQKIDSGFVVSPSDEIRQPFESAFARPRDFVIESADVSQLTETSIAELLEQINEKLSQTRFAPWAAAAAVIVVILSWYFVFALVSALFEISAANRETAYGVASLSASIMATVIAAAGLFVSWRVHKGDELKRTTPLFYELEKEAADKFNVIQQANHSLSRAIRIWRVHTNQPTWDWKRNAGASSLITRQPISVRHQQPPYIATNVDVWTITLNDMSLYFLPDYIFVRQRGMYGAISYDSFSSSFSPTRFIEDQSVPKDAQVVDYTWRFVNKKGGPDRRFANNWQLPIAEYGFIELQSTQGLNIHLHVSNREAARRFVEGFDQFGAKPRSDSGRRSRREASPLRPSVIDPELRSAFEILGISVTASADEIVSAYRNMAKMYHPDRLVNMAPEFTELAEERMKQINRAYELLKRR